MELELVREFKKDDYINREYKTNNTIQQENFCELLKTFEDDSTKLYKCSCRTYNDNGYPITPKFKSIEELQKEDFPNSDILFAARFIDRNTEIYKFSVSAYSNSSSVDIFYDPEMISITKEDIEYDRMFEELKKKREEEKKIDEGGYTK